MAAPILANGMVLIGVYMLWQVVLLCAGALALASLVAAIRRPSFRFAVAALAGSLVPLLVPLFFFSPLSRYGAAHTEPVILFGLSTLPPLISGLALFLSSRRLKGPK